MSTSTTRVVWPVGRVCASVEKTGGRAAAVAGQLTVERVEDEEVSLPLGRAPVAARLPLSARSPAEMRYRD
jgi:hypothetical protein